MLFEEDYKNNDIFILTLAFRVSLGHLQLAFFQPILQENTSLK